MASKLKRTVTKVSSKSDEVKTNTDKKVATKKKEFKKYPYSLFKDEDILKIDVKKIDITPPEEYGNDYKNDRSEIYYINDKNEKTWFYLCLSNYFCFGIKQFGTNPNDKAPYTTSFALNPKPDDPNASVKLQILEKLKEVEKQIRMLIIPYAESLKRPKIKDYTYFEDAEHSEVCRLISYSAKDTERKQPTLKSNLWVYVKNSQKICGTSIFEKNKTNSKGNLINYNKNFTNYTNFATVKALIHLKSIFLSSKKDGPWCIQSQLMEIEFPEEYHNEPTRTSLMYDGKLTSSDDTEIEETVTALLNGTNNKTMDAVNEDE